MIFVYIFLIILFLGMLFVIFEAITEGEISDWIHERLKYRLDRHRPNKK